MTRKEPAVLWFGSDFYEDEHVLQMTYEQQGVYQRLLWIAHRNEGLPADPAALARMLGLPAKRFASKVWPAIAPCWEATGDGSRLIQRRQEEERARRASSRGEAVASSAAAPVEGSRSERMRDLAKRRWSERRMHADAGLHADAHAGRNATPHADADAGSDAGCNAASHLPPAPPSVQVQENQPQRARADAHAHADARRNAAPHAAPHAAPEGASSAQSTEPEPAAEDPTLGRVIAVQRALLFTGLRSKLPGFTRSRALTEIATRVEPTGITPDDVAELWLLAQRKTTADPGGLLDEWLVRGAPGTWRGVLDEQRGKAKQADLRRRAPDALDGIYGGDAPQTAGAGAAAVLAAARPAGVGA